ncbi:matrix metalloproteinase-17b [Chanos chanos]|uniref:Matrix metalloproteinase-17b n=1 Tax=Chanos chanos TaxID=29144 RepID=A0A6J2W3U8_CHACN|nr:matrix metalloproteinase-17-like [Chanos chanos]
MKVALLVLIVVCVCGDDIVTASLTTAGDRPVTSPAIPVTVTSLPSTTPTEDESVRLVDWLMKYGYLPPPDASTGQLQTWTAVTQAVKAMQKFAGLEETGVVDKETAKLMQTPRCSLPDSDTQANQHSTQNSDGGTHRIKRAASTWARRNINWRLRSYPISSALSREMVRTLLYYSLRVWAEPTQLEFHEVGGPEGADLQVDFLHGPHGDGYPFDGVGGAVGHAFFPSDQDRAGEVHLDADEYWAFRQPASEGTDLFTVLVHELGHALGLSHSSARRSVMRPYYHGPLGDPLHFSLGPQDLEHITALYGQHTVDRCNTSFDTVAKIRGETFFFKGLSMWRVSRGGLVSGRAVSVRRLWTGLPPSLRSLRAVLERHSDHAIIFISGSQFWLFKDLSLQEGFPQPLSELVPGGLDGSLQGLLWDPDEGATWGQITEREEGTGGGEEEESEIWRELIEGGVNGIIPENDGSVYLFKGHSYWKFPYPGSTPEEGYPRPLGTDWLDCPQPSPYDLSDISLTVLNGKQELRESQGQRTVDQIRQEDKITDRDIQEHWDCPCLNKAAKSNMLPLLLVPTLLLSN